MTNQINALGSEVRELKKFALDVHNFAYGTEWDDKDIVSAMDFDGIVEKMKEDEKELQKEIERLKKNEKAYENKIFSLNQEIESLKKSNKQKTKLIHRFREQVKGLDKVMLSSAFQSWREVQSATNPQYTIQDEIDFLNGETTNQELINQVFEDLYPYEYEYDAKNKTYIDHNSDTTSDEEGYTHGVSIDCEDVEEEELFHSYEEAEKYYYKCVAEHKGSKTKIYFYSVPEEYDGGCESFKDGWIIRATDPDEE